METWTYICKNEEMFGYIVDILTCDDETGLKVKIWNHKIYSHLYEGYETHYKLTKKYSTRELLKEKIYNAVKSRIFSEIYL